MKNKTVGAIAIAAFVGATTLLTVGTASAALTTKCVGDGGAVTVPGDLVVPAGMSCTLTGTTVTGDVRIAKGADLIADGAIFQGRVAAANDAYFEASNGTKIAGTLVLNGAYGAYLEDAGLDGKLRSTSLADAPALVYAFNSDLGGAISSNGDELFVEQSSVAGSVDSVGSVYSDVYQSFVDGKLTVSGSALGSVICGTAVQGAASFTGNAGLVQLGSNGPTSDCTTGSYWGSDVSADGNTAGVYVNNNIVRGNVVFGTNDPVAQVGADNTVRGSITGDHENWDGSAPAAAASKSMAKSMAKSAVQQRGAAMNHKLQQRQAAAVASADKAGVAAIG